MTNSNDGWYSARPEDIAAAEAAFDNPVPNSIAQPTRAKADTFSGSGGWMTADGFKPDISAGWHGPNDVRAPEYSLLDTARTPSGATLNRAPHYDDSVDIPGEGRTSIDAAVARGFLRIDAQGNVVETEAARALFARMQRPFDDGRASGPQQQQTQQQQDTDKQDAPAPVEALPTDAENVMQEAVKHLSPSAADAIAAHVMTDGEVPQSILNALASKLGCEPDQAQAKLSTLTNALEQQAVSKMATLGLEGSEVADWARQHAPEAFAKAVEAHWKNGSTSGYRALAKDFALSLEKTPEGRQDLLSSELPKGYSWVQSGNRVGIRFPDGSTHGFQELIREGKIKV